MALFVRGLFTREVERKRVEGPRKMEGWRSTV